MYIITTADNEESLARCDTAGDIELAGPLPSLLEPITKLEFWPPRENMIGGHNKWTMTVIY